MASSSTTPTSTRTRGRLNYSTAILLISRKTSCGTRKEGRLGKWWGEIKPECHSKNGSKSSGPILEKVKRVKRVEVRWKVHRYSGEFSYLSIGTINTKSVNWKRVKTHPVDSLNRKPVLWWISLPFPVEFLELTRILGLGRQRSLFVVVRGVTHQSDENTRVKSCLVRGWWGGGRVNKFFLRYHTWPFRTRIPLRNSIFSISVLHNTFVKPTGWREKGKRHGQERTYLPNRLCLHA